MCWQCPTCETVNQDVTPICTVCDSLSPVIESFLSLESIEDVREYNIKLDEVHRLEISGDYEKMLTLALEAIAIYKENGLALEKAKQALKHLNKEQLNIQLTNQLKSSIEKKNYLAANLILRLIENFHLEIPDYTFVKTEIKSQISKEKEIDEILKDSYKSIISLELTKAAEIVEEGLGKYPSSKLLQYRRDDIRDLISAINNLQKKTEDKKRTFPKPPHRTVEPTTFESPRRVISLDKKRKFPKPKRK